MSGPSSPVDWEFAGWGSASKIDDLGTEHVEVQSLGVSEHHKLGTWRATAICGNDITSSCLYVSALCGIAAGPLAPLVLLVVAGVLYLYRRIYAEVGSAIPLNGGTYTLLLNCTSKKTAALAACLTLLSYIATAVISASEAMHYLQSIIASVDVFWATIGLLGFFAMLTLIGISESAGVALAIFVFHMFTLVCLSAIAIFYVVSNTGTFQLNWHMPPPGGILHALFFGFAAAMLGISGFESSANFIEEQQDGVFPKTLRNMWIAVAVFNPLLSLLAMGVIPFEELPMYKAHLLAEMGDRTGGSWLSVWVSIDAVLVLSGAVLTSFVGVTGLVRRMTLDACMPQILLAQNKLRGTNHWIILGFLAMSCSIFVVTGGDVTRLAGVYTLSFLSVMALYSVGNMLLKVTRSRLPRAVRASWLAVAFAFVAVLFGLAGNLSFENLKVTGTYLAVVAGAVTVMFLRIVLLRGILFVSQAIVDSVGRANEWIRANLLSKIRLITNRKVVYFTAGDSMATLNKAALYVLRNEQTNNLKVIHVYEREQDIPHELAEHLKTVDKLYPKLRIDFVAVQGTFGPEIIEKLSRRLDVPKNNMFIGTPGDRFPHRVEHLGGVRLIL